jgi:hypothetical protein
MYCQYHSTSATDTFSSTSRSYQDKTERLWNIPQRNGLSEVVEHWIEKFFQLFVQKNNLHYLI